jgi:hypothetical protein
MLQAAPDASCSQTDLAAKIVELTAARDDLMTALAAVMLVKSELKTRVAELTAALDAAVADLARVKTQSVV